MTYWPAIIISLTMHSALIAVLAWGWQFAPQKTVVPPPNFIKATLLAVEPTAKPKVTQPKKEIPQAAAPKPPPKKVDLTKQRQEQERLKKLAADKKKKDQLAKQKADQVAKEKQARIKRENEAKLAAEKAAQEAAEAAAKQKEQQEQLRLQAEQERQRQEEQEQQRIRKEQQQALLDDIAKEKAQIDAQVAAEQVARQAAEDEVAKQSYSDLIRKRITGAWSRPPSARNNMIVELTIELIPTGEVVNVNVTDSSGNAAYDRSAVRAVNRVGAFPELREMSRRLFDSEFRSFKLAFSPEDLRQ